MIFKRFEALAKWEGRFFTKKIPSKIVFTVIFSSFIIYDIFQLSRIESSDFYTRLTAFLFLIPLVRRFPYILVPFLADIHNNQKKIFIFELTKKEIEINNNKNNYYLFFHHKRKFKLNKAIQNMEKFYDKIEVGDIIELHQLPKSGEFIKIQKVGNTTKDL